MNNLRLVVFFILLFSNHVVAQTTTIDSLRLSFYRAISNKEKMEIAFQICEQRRSLNADSLYKYASIAKEIATANGDNNKVQLSAYFIACSLELKGYLDSGFVMTGNIIKHIQGKEGNADLYRKCLALKSNYLIRDNRYKEAIDLCYQLLSNGETNKDSFAQITAYCGIGWAYMEMHQFLSALPWFRKALHLSYIYPSHYYTVIYSNMAAVYGELKQYDSAEYNINIAISLARQYQTLSFLANSLNIKADIFILTHRAQQAETLLQEALSIRKKMDDPYYIVSDMGQLALYYAHNGNAKKGIGIIIDALTIARRNNITAKLPFLYQALAECYKADGNLQAYSMALEQLIVLKDSIYMVNSAEAIAKLNTKYELQKKENIIIRQKLELVRKDYWMYGALLILLFIISFSIVLFNSYKKRAKLKLHWLLEQEKTNAQHEVKVAEENERKRIAADLHDNLGAYAASIASNIDNITNNDEHLEDTAIRELRNNSLSMVSELNDTIWVLKKDTLSLTAISDRLKAFAQRLQPSYPNTRIEVVENILLDQSLPPSQAFHLFHIIQEAINNALRHSNADELVIHITETTGHWQVKIVDNGVGVSGQEKTSGNGMYNMRNRAEINGWNIQWNSIQPKGTSVEITGVSTTN